MGPTARFVAHVLSYCASKMKYYLQILQSSNSIALLGVHFQMIDLTYSLLPFLLPFLHLPLSSSPSSSPLLLHTHTDSDQSEQAGKMQVAISPPPQPEEPAMSKNAITHSLKKLRGPARCRECDTYVYFHGYECEVVRCVCVCVCVCVCAYYASMWTFVSLQCGLACHKRCLATLAIRCGSKVSLSSMVYSTHAAT